MAKNDNKNFSLPTKKDLEKRILKLLDNFSEKNIIYQLIDKYQKEVKKYHHNFLFH